MGTVSGIDLTEDQEMGVGLGSYWEGYGDFFEGSIDEVKVYDHAITQEKVKELYSGHSTQGEVTGQFLDAEGRSRDRMQVYLNDDATDESYIDSTKTDADGNYHFDVSPGTYYVKGMGVYDTTYASNEGRDELNVSSGESHSYDISAQDGYHLSLSRLKINGSSNTSIYAQQGDEISITFDYTAWKRKNAASPICYVAVGVEDNAVAAADIGIPEAYPGSNGYGSVKFSIPNTNGTDTIFAMIAPEIDESDAMTRYFALV